MANESVFLTTPVVECQYMHFKNPTTNLDPNGIYEGELLFDLAIPEQKEFMSTLKSLLPAGCTKIPYKKHPSKANVMIVKLKQKALVITKTKTYEFKPKFFDANANPIVDIPLIGNGSTVSVNIELRPNNVSGVGLRLNPVAVQLVDLVEYKPSEDKPSASNNNPFAPKQGGFVQHDTGFKPQAPAPQASAPQAPQQAVPQQGYEPQNLPVVDTLPAGMFDF